MILIAPSVLFVFMISVFLVGFVPFGVLVQMIVVELALNVLLLLLKLECVCSLVKWVQCIAPRNSVIGLAVTLRCCKMHEMRAALIAGWEQFARLVDRSPHSALYTSSTC